MHSDFVEREPRSFLMSSHTLANLSRDYSAAVEWLSDLVRISDLSRLNRYKQTLDSLAPLEGRGIYSFLLSSPDHLAAFFEAHEVILAAKAVKAVGERLPIPQTKLASLHQGTLSYVEAGTANDPSRNTFYEFVVAAKLLAAGLPVELPDDRADVEFMFEGYRIFVECKRVTSRGKLVARVKEGLTQLESRYTRGKTYEAGLVFASIAVIANPSLAAPNAKDIQSSNDRIAELTENFSEEVMEALKPNAHKINRKSMAFYLSSRMPFQLMNDSVISMQTYDQFQHFVFVPGSPRDLLFRKFARQVMQPVDLCFN